MRPTLNLDSRAFSFPRLTEPGLCANSLESTGTGKQLKVTLRNEGVDPDVVRDPVFWLHPDKKAYVPFTREDWEVLKAGKVRL